MSSSISSSSNVNPVSANPLMQMAKELEQATQAASQAGSYGPPYIMSISAGFTEVANGSAASGAASGGASEEMSLTYASFGGGNIAGASAASSGAGTLSSAFEQFFSEFAAGSSLTTASSSASGTGAQNSAFTETASVIQLSSVAGGFTNTPYESLTIGAVEGSSSAAGASGVGFFEKFIAEFSASSVSGAASSASGTSTVAGSSSASGSSSEMASMMQLLSQMLQTIKTDLQNTASASSQSGSSVSAAGSVTAGTFGASGLDKFLTNLVSQDTASVSSANGSGGTLLNAAQLKTVQDILTQYQNAPANTDTFKAVNGALEQAGITVSHTGGHHHGGGGGFEALMAATSSSSGSGASSASGSAIDALFGSSSQSGSGGIFESLIAAVDVNTSSASGSASETAIDALFGSSPADSFLSLLGNGSTQNVSAALNAATAGGDSTAFINSELANSGPLPQFLAQVDTHLNAKQAASLQNIANQFANADNTSQTVNSITAALQQAGIPKNL